MSRTYMAGNVLPSGAVLIVSGLLPVYAEGKAWVYYSLTYAICSLGLLFFVYLHRKSIFDISNLFRSVVVLTCTALLFVTYPGVTLSFAVHRIHLGLMLLAWVAVEIGKTRPALASGDALPPNYASASDFGPEPSVGQISRRSSAPTVASESGSIPGLGELVWCAPSDKDTLLLSHLGPGSQHSMSDHSSDIALSQCERSSPRPCWDLCTNAFFRNQGESYPEDQVTKPGSQPLQSSDTLRKPRREAEAAQA